jgi:hypothetical protein
MGIIKPRSVRWAWHTAYTGENTNTKFWFEKLKKRDHLKRLTVDVRILSKEILTILLQQT